MGIQPHISQRRQHETLGVQRLAVRSEDYWDFQPEQRVHTADGYPGRVTAVTDGPFPGSEEYQVVLDHGMGGGAYTASQLRPAGSTTAAMEQTAAADYPELAQILVERPDPALQQVYAAKTPRGGAPEHFDRLVTTAAADADFRFQVTAAWRDVVAKAKRIRAEGRLRVTLASDGLVFAEVKGDNEVYETGIQRFPGKVAAHVWSCGCKWGAYHWGADDDFSRFAGRMCSHALALQYEAQSRGMFGRDINADGERPSWVPRKVVVRYDIDADKHRLAPSTASLPDDVGLMPPAESAFTVLARALIDAGESSAELAAAMEAAGIKPVASVDAPFGEPSGTSYQLPKAPGATQKRMPWENPASAGPLSAADPTGWNRKLPLESYAALEAALFEPGGAEAELHGQPEGALPSTDGVQIPSEDEALTPALAGLQRQALKDFSLAERQALINEGEDVTAANLDRLSIEGTHYADLEEILAAQEDTTWLT
ncbi:hypothetical protein ACFQ6C_26015 [Streptomyces sp. NPDC056454]|uniref:hypothetical protein n=1 Tax=Streptomyces sp. NPDC056454 TaxID=3345823 RepID=UPI00369C8D71